MPSARLPAPVITLAVCLATVSENTLTAMTYQPPTFTRGAGHCSHTAAPRAVPIL